MQLKKKKCWDPVMILLLPSLSYLTPSSFFLSLLSPPTSQQFQNHILCYSNYLCSSKPPLNYSDHRLEKAVYISEICSLLIALPKSIPSFLCSREVGDPTLRANVRAGDWQWAVWAGASWLLAQQGQGGHQDHSGRGNVRRRLYRGGGSHDVS